MSRILSELNKNVILKRHPINKALIYNSIRNNLKRKSKEPLRKPIWQPMAPSKLFRIRTKPKLTDEETKQREHFINTFDNNMRSINEYFRNEFYLPTLEAGGLTRQQVEEEERDQIELIQQNDSENQRTAQLRAERVQNQLKLLDQQLIVSQLEANEELKRKGQQIDEIVKKEIERSKSYITHENIESAIEECLANPISYDFSIDTFGQISCVSGSLHPYALRPSAVPEMASNTDEYQSKQDIQLKLQPKHLY